MRTRNSVLLSACLLSSTFLIHPAFAANNNIVTQSPTATNSGTVTSTNSGGTSLISGGANNTIGATATGALATVSVSQTIENSTLNGGSVPNSVTSGAVSATNSGTVQATTTLPVLPSPPATATISNGVSNFIGASAGGASAGASVSQTIDTSTVNGGSLSNAVQTGTVSAINSGDVQATFSVSQTSIPDGISNFIGASAAGASAGAGITQTIANSTIDPASVLGSNTVTVGGITANNNGTVIATGTFGPPPFSQFVAINNGVSNSIGASAVGASASASVNQSLLSDSADLSVLPPNTVRVNASGAGTDAIQATNTGDIHATFTTAGGHPLIEVNTGIGNSISATAVGASASATVSSLMRGTSTLVPATVAQTNSVNTTIGGNQDLSASNNGTVTARFDASTSGPEANTGISNSIGATAFGASASAGISQAANQGSIDLTSLFNNSVATNNVTASNNASGTVTATLTAGGASIGSAPNIPPIGNSIAAQGVGASASASISSSLLRVGSVIGSLSTTNKNFVRTGSLSATNDAGVTAQSSLTNSTVINGVNGFIGASGAGASAGSSISQAVDGSGIALNNLPGNTVQSTTVTADNRGVITASLTNTGAASVGGTDVIGNSISAQASGASATASITSAFETTSAQTTSGASLNSVTVASLGSTNHGSGSVSAATSVGGLASIGGGVGNSIGATASGASSVASINQVVDNGVWGGSPATAGTRLNTLPTNSISVGTITAANGAPVAAHLATVGGTINGGIGNSIAASAIGASAGASISQIISGVH